VVIGTTPPARGASEAATDRARCPYPKPFPREFTECPTYQATSFLAADSHDKPLGAWLTCRHLTTGTDSRNRGRFYPRCALGTREQRLRWLGRVSRARLDVVRALQEEFDAFSLPHRENLYGARARLQAGPLTRDADGELQDLIEGFLEATDRFLTENRVRFDDVGLPTEALGIFIREWITAWARTAGMATTRVNDETLAAFAPPARAFLGFAPESEPAPRKPRERPVYKDAALEILATVDPPGLALTGDVDASNVTAFADSLRAAMARPGDVHLDLGGLLFCDLGGLQVIVRSAQALGPGRRLLLHGIPRQLERALEIVDWAPLPNIVIVDEGQP
jgi:ABC-type transporter Mla MlaB component